LKLVICRLNNNLLLPVGGEEKEKKKEGEKESASGQTSPSIRITIIDRGSVRRREEKKRKKGGGKEIEGALARELFLSNHLTHPVYPAKGRGGGGKKARLKASRRCVGTGGGG